MALGLYFRPIADLVALLVHEDPIQLWRLVADCGDKSFAFPAPVLFGIRQKITGEGMALRVLGCRVVTATDGAGIDEQLLNSVRFGCPAQVRA